jgi:DNA repair ATPase RecN
MKPACTPTASDLDSSKMSEAYAAQEEALTAIDAATDFSGVQDAVDECVSRVNELIGEYEDTANEYPMTAEALGEKVDVLSDWVSAMEGYSPNEVDEVDDTVTDERTEEDVESDQDEYDEALNDAKEEARDLVNEFSG